MSTSKEILKWIAIWMTFLALMFTALSVDAKARPNGHQAEAEIAYQLITPQVALISVDGQPAQEAIVSYSWFGNGFPTPEDFVVALITKDKVYVIYKDYYQVFKIERK